MRTLQSLRQMTLFAFRSLLRNKIAFFFNLVLPVVLVAIFGSMFGTPVTGKAVSLGWVDGDGGPVGQSLKLMLTETGRYRLVTGDEADLRSRLGKGKLRAILILPAGLSEKVAAGSVPEVTILRDQSNTASLSEAGALSNLVRGIGVQMAGARPVMVPKFDDLPGVERYDGFDFLMPGQLVYMLLAAGLMSVSIALAFQRQTGTLRHLFTTPLSMGTWVTAQVLANLLLASIQIVVLFIAARIMFGVHMPVNIGGTVVALFVSALACLSMGLAVGALVKSSDAAFPVSMILFFGFAMFGNAMMPIDGAPEFILKIQKLTPTLYMTNALRQTMMQGKGLGAVIGDLGILAGCITVFGSLAVWRIRKQMTAA